MDQATLGTSGVQVSAICLGTMTFGTQTPEDQAHPQLDRAFDAGITFFDTAEMYPVNPIRRETAGNSERMLGRWIAARGLRGRVQVATKITGPGGLIRPGETIDAQTVTRCIDESLERLGVETLDLYQLHWPVRGSYAFRQDWNFDPSGQVKAQTLDHMRDVLGALKGARDAGKIRAAALSNESAWGLARWCDVADAMDAPRMVAMQNEYSLLYRRYDTDLAEAAVNEGVTLLSYSPLAAGLLTGKYAGGAVPEGSRAAVDRANSGLGNLGGRKTARALAAVEAYGALAKAHGWDLIHMAIAWQRTRPFPVIPILGATTPAQLDHILAGLDRRIDDELRRGIERLHKDHASPY